MSTRSLTSLLLGVVLVCTLVIAPGVLAQSDAPPDLTYHSITASGWAEPLEAPVGFTVDEVASGLTTPRFIALDTDGSLVVAEHLAGKVVRLRDSKGTGHFDVQQDVASGLTYVNSVVFVNGQLYAAAEDRVVVLSDFGPNGKANLVQTIVEHLPAGARDLYGHRTRTLLPGADGKLYLSIGSACDSCVDDNPLRATIARMDPDGSNLEVFATGLRNSVGIAFRPQADPAELWGADMGRNDLGAGLPPDELNLIQQGLDYGWPYCMGDGQLDPQLGDPDRCSASERPRFLFPAHWARPVGLVVAPDGSVLVSDDWSGRIFRIRYSPPPS